ncbi:restriction endonuclease subunit S [Agrobacterium rhizogenes]|nr:MULTISPECIES: restriction endonuclease subunit S [Rhizobium/Agrobacterium group]MDA5633692.1 restriction endonuclease subunit S [Agrobacterium sp. ST15.16.024]MDF1892246.1 restriction endonuclease subunit S [Rhizobium rhizogenes]
MVRLGDVVDIRGGGTPSKDIPEYWGGSIPWASVKDFKSAEIAETVDAVTEAGVRNSATNIIPAGNILVPTRMAVGKAAINKTAMAINQDIKALFPRPGIDPQYLLQALLANSSVLERQATGATVKGITLDVLKELRIPFPPLNEQKRIAAILDKADALRAKRRQAIALLDSLTQSIFHEMFGDPVSNPNGYAVRELQEIIDPNRKITYGILMPGPDIPGGIPYVRVVDMRDGMVLSNQLRRTTPAIAREYRRSALKAGDLLISIRGHVGRIAVTPPLCDGANITQDTARLAIVAANSRFIGAQLASDASQHWMARRTKGVAVRGINLGDLKKFPVMLPPEELQIEFAEKIEQQAKLLQLKEIQVQRHEALFASLQHRAFTGQL